MKTMRERLHEVLRQTMALRDNSPYFEYVIDDLLNELYEPDSRMVEAGATKHSYWSGKGTVGARMASHNVPKVWQAMIKHMCDSGR